MVGRCLALAAALAAACFVRASRHRLPRPAAHARSGRGEGGRATDAARHLILAGLCVLLGILPLFAIELIEPVNRRGAVGAGAVPDAGATALALADTAGSRREFL